ncbi:MAG: DbpA RNA binding domain-containing protein [Gemmatimonadaceae bacterium]|nr:DbpA RNA binding domain-containing protein [Gemmatimonadaceae bacterium]
MSEEQSETTEATATIGRSPGTVYVLPHTSDSIPEFLSAALGRIDPESPSVQVLILTADGENALAIAEMAHSLNGATGIEVLPATRASRSARLLKARPVRAISGTPEELIALVSASALKLDELRVVVIAWAEDLLDQGERAVTALETILSDAGKSADRIIVTRRISKPIEDFVERYARRARRAPMPMDDIGTGEIPEVKYLTTAGIAKPASLRRLLDELDPPSAAIVVRTAAGEIDAERVLHTLGYSGEDSPVTVVRGAPSAAVHTIIIYDAPVRRSEIHALGTVGAVNVVTLVTPAELSPIRELFGAKLSPLNFSAGTDKLRRRDDAMRSELRSVLSAGIPPREIAPLEPLLAEYDAVEIAAAALQLLERERRVAKAAPPSMATTPAAAPEWTGATSKLFVTLGDRDGIKPGDLVGTIAGEAGIPGGSIGKVEVYESHTIVEVPAAESEKIITALNGKTIKGRKVAVRADRPKSERKSSEGDSRGGDRPPRRTFDRDDRPRPSGPRPPRAAGDRPRSGYDRPRPGSDRPRPGSDRPRPGADRPRPSSDRPRFGSDRPRPGSDRKRPGADRPRSGPPRKGRPER